MKMLSLTRDELAERVRNRAKPKNSQYLISFLPDGNASIAVEKAQIIQLNPPAVRVSGPSNSDREISVAFEQARIIQLQPFTEALPKIPDRDGDDGDAGDALEQARFNELETSSVELRTSAGEPEEQLIEREPMLEMCINTLSAQIVELQNSLNIAQRLLSEQQSMLHEERQNSAELLSQVRGLKNTVRSLQQLRDTEFEKPWWSALVFAR